MSQSDFVTRGQALVTSGQYQEAVKVCRLGLLGRPTTVDGRVVLGQALLALKRYDEVLAEMRVALDLDHASVPAQLLKAEALIRKGEKAAALEVLDAVRAVAPREPKLVRLAAEARVAAPLSSSQRAVGFVGNAPHAAAESTRHYPSHVGDDDEEDDDEPRASGAEYTRPTSLATPGSAKRSGRAQAMREPTPSPALLAVGDRSGTVELDPEHEGVEVNEDDDFGDVAAPPSARPAKGMPAKGVARAPAKGLPAPHAEARGAVKRAVKRERPEESSVELSSEDLLAVDETRARRVGSSAVRNAVSLPAGPLDGTLATSRAHRPTAPAPLPGLPAPLPGVPQAQPAPTPASMRKTEVSPVVGGPAVDPHSAPPFGAAARPGKAGTIDPRSAIAAAQPTVAAVPIAAALPTMAVVAPLPPTDRPWSNPTVLAGADAASHAAASHAAASQPTQVAPPDPRLAVELPYPDPAMLGHHTGVRRVRSRFGILAWILVGALVIGGGVFAGFQIRAMRLGKQIANARAQATALAATDTYAGWAGARDRLAGVAQASATVENRAALARARGVLAYEFGDGVADAKRAVAKLAGAGGLDGALAAAYTALAASDGAAAKAAADQALAAAANDAAAQYASGEAALLEGDVQVAIEKLRGATDREQRPLYFVGLARALGATGAWDDALAATARALAAVPDHPAALIERALLLSASGRLVKGAPQAAEVRAQLSKLVADSKPGSELHGASPAQVALAHVALAQVAFEVGDVDAVRTELSAAIALEQDEPRYAEEAIDTLYAINNLNGANGGVTTLLATWPGSVRGRISHAQILLAMGKGPDALAVFTAHPEVVKSPRGQAVRGLARLATGDLEGARADLDVVLKKYPALEVAIVGRAWVHLAAGETDEARQLVEPTFDAATASPALATVYAATLRAAGDPTSLDRAKQTLEQVVAGPVGVDVPRAQLELARVLRDLGDTRAAKNYFAEATRNGSTEARLELALLQIEDRDPTGGRDTLDQLIKDAGDTASASLLVQGARARMLVGDHAGAAELLDRAEKLPDVVRWRLERERARLLLRKGDLPGAAKLALAALEGAGTDTETFLLAADIVGLAPKQAALAQRLQTLVAQRLKTSPEGLIVTGKLAIAAEKYDVAEASYTAAAKALEKATPRRLAQAHFGLAVVAYFKGDDPTAKSHLDLVREEDPSIYGAYLYAAEVNKTKPALAFELVQKAVTFNPDYVDGWFQVGQYAAKLKKSKELADAITHLAALAPGSEQLAALQALK